MRVLKNISAIANPVAISVFEIRARDTISHSSSVRDVLVADNDTNRQVAIGMAVEKRFANAVSLICRQKIHFLLGLSARCTISTIKGPKAGMEMRFKKSFPDIKNFSWAFTNHPTALSPVYDSDKTHAAFQKPATVSFCASTNPSMNKIANCFASGVPFGDEAFEGLRESEMRG